MRQRDRFKVRTISTCLGVGAAVIMLSPVAAVASRDELQGTWLQLQGSRPEVKLTPAGEAVVEAYEPLRDDPDVHCKPPSVTNVIAIPDPPWELRLHDDQVEMNFEYMDVKRRMPIDADLDPGSAPYTDERYPHLGRSVAHYEGDMLVVETADPEEGYVDTLRVNLPQSAQMRTEERYMAEGDRLHVTIKHTDPVYYEKPFEMSFEFLRVDLEVLEFNCTVDAASYDDRL